MEISIFFKLGNLHTPEKNDIPKLVEDKKKKIYINFIIYTIFYFKRKHNNVNHPYLPPMIIPFFSNTLHHAYI